MRFNFYKMAILVVILSICFFQSCDKNCPVCPETPVPESYYVYFADDNGIDTNYIWIADSQTDSIVDSIKTRNSIRHIDVSLDGNYLAATMTYDSIFIFDLETYEIISKIAPPELIGLDKALFCHNGKNIIINSYQWENILKYDIATTELIDEDTAYFQFEGKFKSMPYIYGTRFELEHNWHYIFNYETMETVKQFAVVRPDESIPHAMKMTLSADEKHFYFIIRPDKIFKYEIATDSIIDSLYIINGAYWGDLKCTPDGKFLLVSEVPNASDMMGPLGTFLIIGLDDFSTFRRVSTWGILWQNPVYPSPVGDIIITPDASKTFVSGTDGFGRTPPISINLFDYSTSGITGFRSKGSPISSAIGKKIVK